MMWKAIFAFVLLFNSFLLFVNGYGEPDASGHPNYQERANHVFMNAVRISPSQYKTVYMAGYSPSPANILVNYPAQPPVYLEPKLVSAAYSHSNDMATNGCFSHNSCDGTATFTRIRNFYSCSGTMAENIAAGNADALDTNNQWLCDQVSGACAPDGSANDGHRKNIMGSGYKVVGTGYAPNPSSTYRHYWTQDFGGASCPPAPTSPIYGGSHRTKSGTTKFIAVYYINPAVAPASATVTIAGTSNPLALDIGASGAGTYFFSQTAGTGCRSYYFTFGTYRYPETGCLVTYGEGTCTTSFDATCGGTTSASTVASSTTSASSSTSATTATTSSATTAATTATTSSATTAATTATTAATTATTSSATTATTSTTKAPTTSSTTSTTKAPSTSSTATTGVVSTTAASTTSTATTGTTSTTGSSGSYFLYSTALQNGWVLQYNSGTTITNSFVYSGKTGLRAVLSTSSTANFIMFNHNPTVANVWNTLQFNIAGSGSGTIRIFFNGGYYVDKAITSAWQAVSISLTSLGDPNAGGAKVAQLGAPKQLVFRNALSTGITLYLNNVALV